MNYKLGLIGYPLSHSFSKKYFEDKFEREQIGDHSYGIFPIENITDFPKLLEIEKGLIGLSVTIPYKETIIPFLDELDGSAKEIGAVNCIKITGRGLKGYNTDAFGFRQSLKPFLSAHHNKALIFGAGGAAKAVAYTLKDLGIDFWFVTRKRNTSSKNSFIYEELTEQIINTCKLLVNCTPVGMHSFEEKLIPIPYQGITNEHLVYDLIYNPSETPFLTKANGRGALVCNGYNMLCFQAEEAWRIWREEGQ